ncbi:natural cytotoxicity triggering receptor 3 ligand 1, partial [Pyxicephalus adspersus]|uniref:natural cytotoxicity triggering receptor 3 ligand 1 n=1 Tax=Pyxicephalus adspersus TaxID=30357 RepID=UPI003B5952B3
SRPLGALRVSIRTPLLAVLRDQDVTLPCDISELNTGGAIAVLWRVTYGNGSETEVYEYIDGRHTSYRPGSYIRESEVPRGKADLHLPGVRLSDEGEYTCRVINTPNKAEGTVILQVSVPPLVDVTPDIKVELGSEKTVMCNVHNFYPKDVSIQWVKYCKGSPDCEQLKTWTCMKNILENSDGTFNVTSLLTLTPSKEDDGNSYSCVISHPSLQNKLSQNFTLTVTEKEDNTGGVITAVVLTLLSAGILCAGVFLYFRFIKKNPPILSITGNNELIDMNRTTLTCQIMDFRPNKIEISVFIKRSEVIERIYTWRSGDPVRSDGVMDIEKQSLVNGGHKERPLQLEMEPVIRKKKLGVFICQCSLHITPSYDLDNGAELSVQVKHPALTSPASACRTLTVIGVPPKVLSIMAPQRIVHDEQLTLVCPINGFKPRALSITWLRRERNQETELVTWNSGGLNVHSERYSHNVKEDEYHDKTYGFISALTMKPNVTEDEGVTYICRTFHPATNNWEERDLTMKVTAVPVLDSIIKSHEVARVGEKLDLSCRIHSFYPSHIQVTWYTEDGAGLSSDTTDPLQEYGDLYHVTSTCSYTPTVKDMGKTFRCEVQHGNLTKHINWTMTELASPPTLGDIKCDPALPEPGKPVTLSCEVTDMYPGDPIIQWLWSVKELSPENWKVTIQQDPRTRMFHGTTELTLTPHNDDHFSEVSLDFKHLGKHVTKNKILIMKGFPVVSEIISDPKEAEYGKALTLRCNVIGCNPGDITGVTWSGGGEQRVIPGSDDSSSCTLTFIPTAQYYGKVYICTVTHKRMKPFTKHFSLQLPAKSPILSDIVHPGKVTANQKASFQVTISRFCPKDLQIKWYKEFSLLPPTDVTISEPQIGLDDLYTCTSTLTFTPKTSDNNLSIRCEVAHSQTKAVREKRCSLQLTGSDPPAGKPAAGPQETFHIREITCVTERPRVGGEVTLVAYIEACQAECAEVSWYKGIFPVGNIENQQDGTGCTSTVTFTPEASDTDCTIRLEVIYNYQTVQKSYKVQLG